MLNGVSGINLNRMSFGSYEVCNNFQHFIVYDDETKVPKRLAIKSTTLGNPVSVYEVGSLVKTYDEGESIRSALEEQDKEVNTAT